MTTQTGVITLVVTVSQPVNNSPNVVLSNVNINVLATMSGDATDWQSMVTNITRWGLWAPGVVPPQYYPARNITLITAVQAPNITTIGE